MYYVYKTQLPELPTPPPVLRTLACRWWIIAHQCSPPLESTPTLTLVPESLCHQPSAPHPPPSFRDFILTSSYARRAKESERKCGSVCVRARVRVCSIAIGKKVWVYLPNCSTRATVVDELPTATHSPTHTHPLYSS